jgi:hypothetical protein
MPPDSMAAAATSEKFSVSRARVCTRLRLLLPLPSSTLSFSFARRMEKHACTCVHGVGYYRVDRLSAQLRHARRVIATNKRISSPFGEASYS